MWLFCFLNALLAAADGREAYGNPSGKGENAHEARGVEKTVRRIRAPRRKAGLRWVLSNGLRVSTYQTKLLPLVRVVQKAC